MDALAKISHREYGVLIDLKYATADNFTGKPVYRPGAECYLHPEAAEKLKEAVRQAKAQDYQLRIFDAYRPTEAQRALWNHTPDPDFLADPNKGSPHSRGVAVDLTLCDAEGRDLDMGTPFDAFTPLSHHGNTEINVEAQKNRHLLLGLMTAAGWDCYLKEWWHYQLFNSRNYPLLSDKESGAGIME
jgi:D-alanyl-D-alanine dipeptidase